MRLAMMAAAAAYIASPIDFVPELFLTVFGLADDALMVAWLAGSVLAETSGSWSGSSAGRRWSPGTWCPEGN